MSLPPVDRDGWWIERKGKPPTQCRWCSAPLDIYKNGWRCCRVCDRIAPVTWDTESVGS